MYEDFIADRIAKLRQVNERSARDMSISLGQNQNYINHIENKKMLPSMQSFFYICEFLGITPQEFFDEGNAQPRQLHTLIEDVKRLDPQSLTLVVGIVRMLAARPPVRRHVKKRRSLNEDPSPGGGPADPGAREPDPQEAGLQEAGPQESDG